MKSIAETSFTSEERWLIELYHGGSRKATADVIQSAVIDIYDSVLIASVMGAACKLNLITDDDFVVSFEGEFYV